MKDNIDMIIVLGIIVCCSVVTCSIVKTINQTSIQMANAGYQECVIPGHNGVVWQKQCQRVVVE